MMQQSESGPEKQSLMVKGQANVFVHRNSLLPTKCFHSDQEGQDCFATKYSKASTTVSLDGANSELDENATTISSFGGGVCFQNFMGKEGGENKEMMQQMMRGEDN
jgi:hypothetical protein